jgi:hypothetical protein
MNLDWRPPVERLVRGLFRHLTLSLSLIRLSALRTLTLENAFHLALLRKARIIVLAAPIDYYNVNFACRAPHLMTHFPLVKTEARHCESRLWRLVLGMLNLENQGELTQLRGSRTLAGFSTRAGIRSFARDGHWRLARRPRSHQRS